MTSAEKGERELLHREVFAVLDVQDGRFVLSIAEANGSATNGALAGIIGQIAGEAGSSVISVDLQPSATNDSRSMAAFYATFDTWMTGFVFAGNSHGLTPGHRRRTRVLSALGVEILTGAGAALLVGPILGAIPAPFWVI